MIPSWECGWKCSKYPNKIPIPNKSESRRFQFSSKSRSHQTREGLKEQFLLKIPNRSLFSLLIAILLRFRFIRKYWYLGHSSLRPAGRLECFLFSFLSPLLQSLPDSFPQFRLLCFKPIRRYLLKHDPELFQYPFRQSIQYLRSFEPLRRAQDFICPPPSCYGFFRVSLMFGIKNPLPQIWRDFVSTKPKKLLKINNLFWRVSNEKIVGGY